MKKLYSCSQDAELELVKNILSDAGIEAEVRTATMPGIAPAPALDQELWVSEEDYPKAAEVLASWQRPKNPDAPSWTCPACGEVIDAQFTSCWKCGAMREQAV